MTTDTPTRPRRVVSRDEYETAMIEATARIYDWLQGIPEGWFGDLSIFREDGRIAERSVSYGLLDALRDIDEIEPAPDPAE